MNKFCKVLSCLALAAMFVGSADAWSAETYPKRELRSAWVTTAWQLDWPSTAGTSSSAISAQKAQATETLDLLKASGFNAVFFQVRPMADRLYKNNSWTDPNTNITYTVNEPFAKAVSGTRGTEVGYDPLQFWLDEAHKRGMELHAWVNPYRMNTTLSTSADNAVSSWIITYKNNKVFNPALDATIARIENVCRVLAGNYDIDGIVFDDYFYPSGMGNDTSTDAPDYSNYKAYKNAGGTLAVADWRRDNVNRMVKSVYAAINSVKPWVRFGISPAGAAGRGLKSSDGLPALSEYCSADDWQYNSIASDPIAWLRDGAVDYISPQLYWETTHSTNPFGPMSQWWSIVANKFGRHFFASHSISFLESSNTSSDWNEIASQVKAGRNASVNGIFGSVMYRSAFLDGKTTEGLCDVLAEECFQYKAVAPAMTWYSATDLGTVENAGISGTTLTWTAKDGSQRYIVYAIPNSVSTAEAQSVDGGYKSEYIVDVTYSASVVIPSDKLTGYWYAVSVLDRYGNEWTPVNVGEPKEYEPVKDPTVYSPVKFDNTHSADLKSLWVRWPAANPIDLAIEFHRDMVARYEESLDKDIVYIISRSKAASNAVTRLIRFDGETGLQLKDVTLNYDDNWNGAYYPGNGILLDADGRLVTHTLTLANGMLTIATVDAETGNCTTVFSEQTTERIDHLDVFGSVAAGSTWYVYASSPTTVQRWTVNGTNVTKHETMTLGSTIGNGSRVHAVSANRFWVSGQAAYPQLYDFGNTTPICTLSGDVEPGATQATDLVTFTISDRSYMFMQHNYPGSTGGIQWSLLSGDDLQSGISGAKMCWTMPEGGAGTSVMESGDFGAPVSVVLPDNKARSTVQQEQAPARLYAYSPGNALVAYQLVPTTAVGVDNVIADDDNAPVEWFTIGGQRLSQPVGAGLYLRRQGAKVSKVVVK